MALWVAWGGDVDGEIDARCYGRFEGLSVITGDEEHALEGVEVSEES